ncbi:LiaF transmembrane domain-containing protein [Tissierella carlieri]|uniref:LiaF transmembrane domain-containing protein n=1 Tax=Tissierella carlieri TaxID=689904 RepID=UPI003865D71B
MNGKYFWGIILILIGAGFLLDQFAIISFGEIFSLYWPSILILVGLLGFLDRKSSKFSNTIMIIIGAMIQIDRLDLVDINLYRLIGPIVLILVGLKIIFSRSGFVEITTGNDSSESSHNSWSSNRNITLEDTIDAFVMMSGIETNNQSQEFKGGRATAVMGGIDIDLRGAKLYNNEAHIEVNAIMAGVEIFVPDGWRVEVTGFPLLGGWSNKTRYNGDPDAPLLKIKCFVMFGGMDIK